MRQLVVASAVVLALSGGAKAFDFNPDDFGVLYSEEAKREGRLSHIHMVSCKHTTPDSCTYQGEGDTLIHVIGSHENGRTKTVAMLLTTDTAEDKALFKDAPFMLMALTSPKANEDERKAIIREVFPASIAAGAEPRFAMPNDVKYTAGVMRNFIMVMGAIDTKEP